MDSGTPGTTISHVLIFPCPQSVFPDTLFPLSLLLTGKHSSDHPVNEVPSSNFTITVHCGATVTRSGPGNCPEQDKLSGKQCRESWNSSSVEGC